MKQKFSKLMKCSLLGLGLTMSYPAAANLDVDSSTANLTVALYATLTGLDDFTMTKVSGSNTYSGSDQFSLVTNGAVRVTASAAALSGTAIVPSLTINSNGSTLDTPVETITDTLNLLDATADLGGANALAAGTYISTITLTVSAI